MNKKSKGSTNSFCKMISIDLRHMTIKWHQMNSYKFDFIYTNYQKVVINLFT